MIQTERLDLIPMTPGVLRAFLAGEYSTASQLLGVVVPQEWEVIADWLQLRLSQLEEDPGLQPWLLRAVCLRQEKIMVGTIGFHSAPGPEWLALTAPGGIEFGYEVIESRRRQGIAMEACRALMAWAAETHKVERFVVSISPENLPSLGLAAKLGFRKIGSQIDEFDGPEDVFELWVEPPHEGEG